MIKAECSLEDDQQPGSRGRHCLQDDQAEGEEEVEEPHQNGHAASSSRPQQAAGGSTPKHKLTIKLKGQGTHQALGCHVCGKLGHSAGFVGATYIDCPNKCAWLGSRSLGGYAVTQQYCLLHFLIA